MVFFPATMSPADRDPHERWMAGYLRAWRSDDPAEIGALFTEDATYSPHPFGTPWVGSQGIVDEWIRRGDAGAEWSFDYEIVAVDGRIGLIRGLTTYAATKTTPETIYGNLWIVTLADDGKARSFSEWWVQKPEPKA